MRFIIQLILELIVIFCLCFNLFISGNTTNTITLICAGLFLIVTSFLNHSSKIKTRKVSECISIIVVFSTVLLLVLYLIGLKTGYNQNFAFIFKNYIAKTTWISIFMIVAVSEYTRYLLCCIETKKLKKIFIMIFATIIFILIDISITTKVYDFTTFNQTYTFVSLVLLPSLIKNLFLNYLSSRFEYYPCLVYRLFMDLYVYFLPLTPKLNELIESAIYIIYPYVLYTIVSKLDDEEKEDNARKKKHNYAFDVAYYLFAIIFIMLISREFLYSVIAIGSNSMKGCFSKGDAVLYKRYEKDKLKKGDIILFKKQDRIVVHRINDIYRLYGENKYITKGDNNDSIDNWVVENNEIVGIVKAKVKYVGWPTVLLSEAYK